jgi:hypothetical protein
MVPVRADRADDYTLYLDGRNNAVLARGDASTIGEDTPLTLAVGQFTASESLSSAISEPPLAPATRPRARCRTA